MNEATNKNKNNNGFNHIDPVFHTVRNADDPSMDGDDGSVATIDPQRLHNYSAKGTYNIIITIIIMIINSYINTNSRHTPVLLGR